MEVSVRFSRAERSRGSEWHACRRPAWWESHPWAFIPRPRGWGHRPTNGR